ncbi:MAG: 3-phenylpropionate/cinnamic acid dioxygenase subunit beta [Deltaproteobacteria bacterium]|nr:3-phenylpropionate/cinnamic acid dioxygenase subunit beta [Deltaproteobacteria bacterium]
MANELRQQVEDFYYLEAELLDERKLREWFNLLAEDIRYWMPIRHNTLERPENISEELSKPGEGYYFDDDIKALKIRVERAYSKIAWAEVPPSRTRHLITNVRIKNDHGNEIAAHSNFLVYRTRMESDKDLFVGARQDILRRAGDSFLIARRTIILDQAVLDAKNISVFL